MSEELREQVREQYAEAARGVKEEGEGCCSSSCCGTGPEAQRVDLTAGSYSDEELTELPAEAVGASLGCGNPTALATLSAGEVVLDLGSGGGIDVLLSARRVSPGERRVKMLAMMAEGRGCCDLPDLGVPAGKDENPGICVCEFEDYFGMGQSKVSYHVGKLREAGLVREERRGRWSFYSLDRNAARELLADTKELLSA